MSGRGPRPHRQSPHGITTALSLTRRSSRRPPSRGPAQIQHMIKHRYVPFAWGKKQYKEAKGGKKKGDDIAPLNPAPRPVAYATIAEPRFTGSNLAR